MNTRLSWPARQTSLGAAAFLAAKLVLAGVFIVAGAGKIMQPQDFAQVIAGYGLAPEWALLPLAVLLPALEILAGAGLVFNVRGSLAVVTGMLAFFIAVLWHGVAMGLDIDCGCYAPGDPEGEAYHGLRQALLRDVVLLALCLWCWLYRRRCVPTRPRRRLSLRAWQRLNLEKGEDGCAK